MSLNFTKRVSMTKDRKKNIDMIIIISSIILLIILLIATLLTIHITGVKAKKYIGGFIPEITLLADGMYKGTYEIFGSKTAADIEFTIEAGKVISVKLHTVFHTPGYRLPKKIIPLIEENKDLKFDAVTGATISSYFVKAAIKNAFENKNRK